MVTGPVALGVVEDTPGSAIESAVWRSLADVPDPEIPVLSVLDLGIVRAVRCAGGECIVTITPTYSGCPAMAVISDAIRAALAVLGLHAVIETQLAPAWTTEWLTSEGREKLRRFGIAPPRPVRVDTTLLGRINRPAPLSCPRCGSQQTTLISQFGSTACKALHRCNACLEPFDEFKSH